jgi:3-isopropylmalate/(R)-2-methylmalate dehydratase large subunit
MRIHVSGQLAQGVTSKDLALAIIGSEGADAALYMSVEWHGETIEAMELSSRAVLPNMMAEMGAKNSYVAPDKKVFRYLKGRARRDYEAIYPDPDASYSRRIDIHAPEIEPMIACPHTVDNVKPLSELKGIKVHQAFLGTCTNGRLEDIAIAAGILQGNKVSPHTRLIVIPASSQVLQEALQAGYLETLLSAGAVLQSPGCGPCMGNHMGIPASGEVTISSANRNFRGRMGTKESKIYLGSPAVVAASAVAGELTHPADI